MFIKSSPVFDDQLVKRFGQPDAVMNEIGVVQLPSSSVLTEDITLEVVVNFLRTPLTGKQFLFGFGPADGEGFSIYIQRPQTITLAVCRNGKLGGELNSANKDEAQGQTKRGESTRSVAGGLVASFPWFARVLCMCVCVCVCVRVCVCA